MCINLLPKNNRNFKLQRSFHCDDVIENYVIASDDDNRRDSVRVGNVSAYSTKTTLYALTLIAGYSVPWGSVD